ncbi:hypothetical protein CEXT_256591 [Caerostris extrusa]|uniref:Uncharacterized protein n=1 Tax=Caerostris extrusa TaxID=172846 RepID=A0AAV4R8B4_CAEEX|nr:hypothetical protein CEXT_256591 [Caerostris extrusa]
MSSPGKPPHLFPEVCSVLPRGQKCSVRPQECWLRLNLLTSGIWQPRKGVGREVKGTHCSRKHLSRGCSEVVGSNYHSGQLEVGK